MTLERVFTLACKSWDTVNDNDKVNLIIKCCPWAQYASVRAALTADYYDCAPGDAQPSATMMRRYFLHHHQYDAIDSAALIKSLCNNEK